MPVQHGYGISRIEPLTALYGYARGDEVLLCLAQCLKEKVDPARDFVGHIGGDDFLLVLSPEDWRARLNRLLEDFQSQCRRFYREQDLQAGCFISRDRQGKRREFPLLSLSLGVVHLHPEQCPHLDASQLAALASEAKGNAKAVPGYSLHILDAQRLSA
jgi:GGDEF domain-containing protein